MQLKGHLIRAILETKQASAEPTTDEVEKVTKKFKAESSVTLFVIDEAASLLQYQSRDGVSFFRAMRSVMVELCGIHSVEKLFFVVMASHSNVSQLSPRALFDPSFKLVGGYNDENEGPLEPFILGSSFRAFNNRDELLQETVDDCHKFKTMYTMGRPLWNALLEGNDPMDPGCSTSICTEQVALRQGVGQVREEIDDARSAGSVSAHAMFDDFTRVPLHSFLGGPAYGNRVVCVQG